MDTGEAGTQFEVSMEQSGSNDNRPSCLSTTGKSRGVKKSSMDVPTAYQYEIREKLAMSGTPTHDLFGNWWEGLDTRLSQAEVRPIERATAERIILEYEWLGTMPPFIQHMFGIFFEDHCGGVVIFSQRTEWNLENASKSVIPEDALYLSRGACTHWTPKNSASFLISRACKILSPCTVLAYADVTAGEIGQIYQALNWYCFPSEKTDPTGYFINGKSISTRTLRARHGTHDYNTLKRIYGGQELTPIPRKIRYVGVYGDRGYRRYWYRRLNPQSKPYPKRKIRE
jgi:hypothetical protein